VTKLLYLDIAAGISGDMFVASLLDLGADERGIRETISGLGFGPIDFHCDKVRRGPLAALRFSVSAAEEHHHRSWREIETRLLSAPLGVRVRERSLAVFAALARAEGRVHGLLPEEVTFHEVGAIDSIADVVGAAVALEALDVDRIVAGSVPLGTGTVTTRHGLLPLPAPATLVLLEGWPVHAAVGPGEWVTPTGAALLAALAGPGALPPMTLSAVGHGAGSREEGPLPNVLRALLGDDPDPGAGLSSDEVEVVEAEVDDMPGEWVPPLFDALFEAGALDVFATSVTMKKGRPGLLFTVLAPPGRALEVGRTLLVHATTNGLRHHRAPRWILPRSIEIVKTPLGPVRVKVAVLPGLPPRMAPEYEDCARVAREHGIPIAEVFQAVLQAARK
jgi:pyridinium-3,5-bisthiocarboxylic acid mononucleotide nickel chelatase